MNLEDTKIYPFIKNRMNNFSLHSFEPGNPISLSALDGGAVWYLVSGTVEAVTTTHNGQVIRIELVEEDDFVGELSRSWGEVFYGDSIAYTPCKAIRIPGSSFERMIEENPDFRDFYQRRCLVRIYGMYKEVLATRVFSQRQLFAAQVLEQARGSELLFIDFPDMCYYVNASRRNIYNLIRTFEKEGLVEFKKGKTLLVKDFEGLRKVAKPVLEFMSNKI